MKQNGYEMIIWWSNEDDARGHCLQHAEPDFR